MSTILQLVPALESGGVERGTVEVSRAIVQAGHRSIVISAGGRMVVELERDGAEHITWPIGKKSPMTLLCVRRLRRLIRARRVDLVHACSRVPAWVALLALRGMEEARPAFVTSVHGMHSVNLYSAVMARGDAVIAVSESMRHYIEENYPTAPHERIRVIHRGVDTTMYHPGYAPPDRWRKTWRETMSQLEGRHTIVLPGRLSPRKGHAHFLLIIDALVKRGASVHGLIVGGASGRRGRTFEKALRTRATRLGIADNVTFTGVRNDLRDILASTDVSLSLSEKPEAFGRTVLEALSLGRGVIGYDHGGVGEQLRALCPEGAVPPGDWQEVVRRILEWRNTPPQIRGNDRFTLARMQSETIELYEQLLSRRARGREAPAAGTGQMSGHDR